MRTYSPVVLLVQVLLLIGQWTDAATPAVSLLLEALLSSLLLYKLHIQKVHSTIHEEIGPARNYDAVQVLLKKYYKKAARRFGISPDYVRDKIYLRTEKLQYSLGSKRNKQCDTERFF
jgi:hypothetical protein